MHILFVYMVNLNFLSNSQLITLTFHSSLVLYSFCAKLLHSLMMSFIVSSLSLYNLHVLFCCVLSILVLIWLIFMGLFCDISRYLVSLLKFPFLSNLIVFSSGMLLISRLNTHTVVFLPIFIFFIIVVLQVIVLLVSLLVAVIITSPCFLLGFRVVVSMSQYCLQCWQVLFFPHFMIHIVWKYHFWDVMPHAWSYFFLFLHPVVGMFSCHLPSLDGRIYFHYFWMTCFDCIVLPFVDIFLIFLLPVISGLFPWFILFFILVLFIPICPYIFLRFPLFIIFPCFRRFFTAFPVELSIVVLIFFFMLFEGIPIYRESFMVKTRKTWRGELTAGLRSLAETNIQIGILQEDAVSPLLFTIAMMPLNHILRICTNLVKSRKKSIT